MDFRRVFSTYLDAPNSILAKKKTTNLSKIIKFTDFTPFPLIGVPWAAVILLETTPNNKSSQNVILYSV